MRLALLVVLLSVVVTHATLRHVPADFNTVQSAILACVNRDTVLVAEGHYTENIDFRGRSIVVASEFLLDGNVEHIPATILDGSQPEHSDSGSVVRIISGEDSTTALIGFTITGGTGTKFRDQSDNLFYVEGGGIIIENSDPLIAFNYIYLNSATRRPQGTQSAGGGAIRYGYCSPRIHNNVITHNSGRYGGGIVSFFADGDLRNNVIANNNGGEDYGGGGLWIGGTGHSTNLINNTIGGNTSVLSGGGIRLFAGVLNGHGNIVLSNEASSGTDQIAGASANLHLDYTCVAQTLNGTDNINSDPLFAVQNLELSAASPCIDAGNPDAQWNDTDGTRNDIGCYGGPGAHEFFHYSEPSVEVAPTSAEINIFEGRFFFDINNMGTENLNLIFEFQIGERFRFWGIPNLLISPLTVSTYTLESNWDGPADVRDTLFVFHNAANVPSPVLFPIHLYPGDAADESPFPLDFALHAAFPNPFNPSTTISFDLPSDQFVNLTITNIQGRQVATLTDSRWTAGTHTVTWNAASIPSGTYFATLRAGKWQEHIKLMLIK